MTEADRMKRAANYVLGLMDEDERERAERELEIDPSFRDAVVEIAERMHVFDRIPARDKAPEDGWKRLKDYIAGMPQMRVAAPPEPSVAAEPPVTFGRRRSDARRETIVPAAAPKVIGIGLHSVLDRRAVMVAAGLIAAFGLGYIVGISSVAGQPPAIAAEP
jgi:hypothetical protein